MPENNPKLVSSLLYTEATTKVKKEELEIPDPSEEDGLMAIAENTQKEEDEEEDE